MAHQQIELLRRHGVSPAHVVLSHVDRNPDWMLHRDLAQTGAFLEYDGPSRIKYLPESAVMDLISKMFELGLGSQILLGGDTARRSYWKANGGSTGIAYILERFIPRLRKEGFPAQAIDAMLVGNPARAFAFRDDRKSTSSASGDTALSGPLTLGIDIGTSSAKAVVADPGGSFFISATRSYSYTTPEHRQAEQNPEDWWGAVCSLTQELLSIHPELRLRLRAVGISGQGVAAVVLGHNRKPLRNAILWIDTRSAPQATQLCESHGERIAAISGKRPATYNVEPKLLWLRQYEPVAGTASGKS